MTRRRARPARLACAALATLVALSPGCGYLQEARTCEAFADHFVPDNEAALLVVWPFLLCGFAVTATIDQALWSFEILPPSGRDGCDFLVLTGNGNNVVLERTIAIPKTVATPLVLIGSYLARWFVPLEHGTRPFGPSPDQRDD